MNKKLILGIILISILTGASWMYFKNVSAGNPQKQRQAQVQYSFGENIKPKEARYWEPVDY